MINSKQKHHLLLLYRSAMVFFVLNFSTIFAFAQVSRYFGQIPVGNSDTNGFVRIDKVFCDIPLGDGSSAELFFKFSSDPRLEPKYMGAYWTIPFFESNVVKISAGRYRWVAPNLRTYTFNKAQKNDRGYKETYVLNTTGELKLNVARDNSICIENVNDSKNRYLFRDGKLVSFCEGKDADTFRISYESSRPRLIYNLSKNSAEAEFVYNRDGFLDKVVISKDKKALFLRYAACDTFAEDGMTKQGNILKSLSSITFADGKKESYKYTAEAGKKDKKILTRNENATSYASVSINKIEQQTGSGNNGFIEWDATTGIIVSDSGGEYAVRNPIFDKHSPEYGEDLYVASRKREMRTKESRISYKKPENKYPDIWDYSLRTAVKITQDPNSGEQTRTSYIGTPGNASMKIRKIEKKQPNGGDWKMELARIYDSNGNLIREIDRTGNLKEFIYDEKGNHWKTLKNGDLVFMAYNENIKDDIRFIKENPDGSTSKIVRREDGIFEIQNLNFDKKRFIVIYNKYKNSLQMGGIEIFIENND